MKLLEILKKYIKFYLDTKIATGKSKLTIEQYSRILNNFYSFVFDEVEKYPSLTIVDLNKNMLNGYVKHLQTENKSSSTQNTHVIIIKAFVTFIADDDIKQYGTLRSEFHGYSIKVTKKKTISFSEDERNRLLDYIESLDIHRSDMNVRDILIIKILLYTGIRATELCNIRWRDVFEEGESIKIRIIGKGGDERFVRIATSSVSHLMDKLSIGKNPDNYMITGINGLQYTRVYLYRMLKKRLFSTKIFVTGVHKFRHSFIRKLQELNYDIQRIQSLTGHKDIQTLVNHYMDTNEKDKEVIALQLYNLDKK